MASFDIEGKLIKKYDVEQRTSTFQSREFVIEVPDGSYSQYVKFQLVQERCSMIDNYEEGSMIKVSFDLRGREWQGKFFTNLNAWRIEMAGGGAGNAAKATIQDSDFPTAKDEPAVSGDDLPF
ncbi:MAG: hypothetical protein RI973_2194 [Bacteroidota bacterium]|jgi:hypothetical protein